MHCLLSLLLPWQQFWLLLYCYNLKRTDMAKAKPDFVITASALQKDLKIMKQASVNIYNKILEVTGKLLQLNRLKIML